MHLLISNKIKLENVDFYILKEPADLKHKDIDCALLSDSLLLQKLFQIHCWL